MEIFSFFFGLFFMGSTPGPNNIILLNLSSNYGYRRAFRYLIGAFCMGVIIGISLSLGLKEIFKLYPQAENILAWLGFSFMIYLASKIVIAHYRQNSKKARRVFLGFWYGFFFQLINPKTWITYITFTSLYIHVFGFSNKDFVLLPLILSGNSFVCGTIWIFGGRLLSGIMKDKFWGKCINMSMVITLVYLAISFVAHIFEDK